MKYHKQHIALATTAVIIVAAILLPKIWAVEHQTDFTRPLAAAETAPSATRAASAAVPAAAAASPPATLLNRADLFLRYADPYQLYLRSGSAEVIDARDGTVLYAKDDDVQRPIASLTKLMTAMVILDAHLPMDRLITIRRADRDTFRGSSSRLPFGTVLTRYDTLHVALAASDNRAAAALARTFPGGKAAFVQAMNAKAQALGMTNTRYVDSTGLYNGDVSTAADIAKLIRAAGGYPLLHKFTTTELFSVSNRRTGHIIRFRNTDLLVGNRSWKIQLSKTGYTSNAGQCLAMETMIANRPVIIVLMDGWGWEARFADARRVRRWILSTDRRIPDYFNERLASARS
ncbi:MAG: D-alanyl-D-alanine endopeptidase [Gammaproteobacteria bacterium]|nr:D-alanyl-D-alanine endopeptidase [Gammaproteobacteria bacterium]